MCKAGQTETLIDHCSVSVSQPVNEYFSTIIDGLWTARLKCCQQDRPLLTESWAQQVNECYVISLFFQCGLWTACCLKLTDHYSVCVAQPVVNEYFIILQFGHLDCQKLTDHCSLCLSVGL